jgi:autotransporter-associated beta strand protein
LTNLGSGTLTLSGTNGYTGATMVGGGTLALTGAGTISNSASLLVAGATLDVSGVTGATLLNSLSLSNSVLNVTMPALVTPVNVPNGSLTMAGPGNVINVASLPPIATYPVTLTLIECPAGISGYNMTLGTLPAATPSYVGNISKSGDNMSVQLTLTSGPIGVRPSVIWSGADVPNLKTNWSDRLNWELPGAPGNVDNVVFNNTAAVSSSALSTPGGGTAALVPANFNNIVDTSFTISTLTFSNLASTYHNTEIASGATLNITNTFTVGGVNTGSPAQQGFTTISGTGAALSVVNTNGNCQVWDGAVSGSQATLDLSALDNFTNIVSRLAVGASINNTVDRPSGILYLAKTNTITADFLTTTTDSGTTTANGGIVVADCNSNAGSQSQLWLGERNIIHADTIGVGRQKAGGILQFNTIYANIAPYPSVAFQGLNGNPISFFEVGNGAGNSGTTTFTADANLTGGFVTASIATLTVGRGSSSTSGSGIVTASMELDAGIISAGTVNIGLQPASSAKYGTGTVTVGTNSTIGANATLNVSGNLNLALATGGTGAGTTAGTLNINGGIVAAGSIVAGTNGASSTVTLSGGTLVVTNSCGTPAAPLTALNLSGGVLQLMNVNGALTSTNIVATTINASGSATINIGSIVNALGTIQIPIISYTGADPYSSLALGTIPAGSTSASLVDDTANSTIDLMVTITINPNPPKITTSVSSGVLTISWPADHTGWILQAQTNSLSSGLSTNPSHWVTVPGSSSVNSVAVTMDRNQSTVFYRLVLP